MLRSAGTLVLAGFFVAILISTASPAGQASAAISPDNTLIVDEQGTVYIVAAGERRPFRSAEVFWSHGYGFNYVVAASSEDSTLPVGPVMTFKDGTLVKDPEKPLVYLVSSGKKLGFSSADAFLGLGYSFNNVVTADNSTFTDLPEGEIISRAERAHPPGTRVVDPDGTVYETTATGRKGFSSAEDFLSYGTDFSKVVPANSADRALPFEGLVSRRVFHPGILEYYPASGEVGTEVSVRGFGFTGDNTVNFGNGYIKHVYSQDNKTLRFNIPSELDLCAPGSQVCALGLEKIQPGEYKFNITNIYGSSNTKTFTVLGKGIDPVENHAPKIVGGIGYVGILMPGEVANFSWLAEDADNDDLSWIIDWGDGRSEVGARSDCRQGRNGWTFKGTHSWAKEGTYKVVATVTDCANAKAVRTQTVTVGVSGKSSITVLSPNGGEQWAKGTTQTIKWKDNTTAICPVGEICSPPAPRAVDIKLVHFESPCIGYPCPASTGAYPAPYTIAKGVIGSSYPWIVGQVISAGGGTEITAPNGAYTVQVCFSGGGECDSSDSHFNAIGETPVKAYLTVSTDSSNPNSALLPAGTSGATVLVANLSATGESVDLRSIHFDVAPVNGGTLNDEFTKAYLYEGSTSVLIASLVPTSTSALTFNIPAAKFQIPPGGSKRLILKVDTAQIGNSQPGDSGQGASFRVLEDSYSAVGTSSLTVLPASNQTGTALGNTFIVVKSLPTFQKLSVPTNTLTNGAGIVLYRFKLTADSRGDIGLYKVAFDVQASGATLSAYQLVEEPGTTSERIASYPTSPKEVIMSPYRGIPVGYSKVYELRATVSNATSGSSVATAMLGDTSLTSPYPFTAIIDSQTKKFIWSDFALDGSANAATSAQWMNGYAVPGLSAKTAYEVLTQSTINASLHASPSNLLFSSPPSGPARDNTIILTNNSVEAANWSVENPVTWLKLSGTVGGTVKPNSTNSDSPLYTQVSVMGLANGTYTTNLKIYGNFTTINIPVTLTISGTTTVLKLTAPNGGEKYGQAGTYYITWSLDNMPTPQDGKIYAYWGKGGQYQLIGSTFATNGYYLWKMPSDLQAGSDYQIMLEMNDAQGNTFRDGSDGYFSIVTGQVSVSLDAANPLAKKISRGTKKAEMLRFKVTNNFSRDIALQSLSVVSQGTAVPTDFEDIYWMSEGVVLGQGRFGSSGSGYNFVSIAGDSDPACGLKECKALLVIPAYSSKSISVLVDVSQTASDGASSVFAMVQSFYIYTNDRLPIFASFPIQGSSMTIVTSTSAVQGTTSNQAPTAPTINGEGIFAAGSLQTFNGYGAYFFTVTATDTKGASRVSSYGIRVR